MIAPRRDDQAREPEHPFADLPIIHSYTRKQAIEDGVLIDLSDWASEPGFLVPVACTTTVWHEWIVPPPDTQHLGQSERGRAHDVLFMLLHAIRRSQHHTSQLLFQVRFVMTGGHSHNVTFKAIVGPGDSGEPVMTLLMPTED